MNLKDKVAIITGSTRGIGRAIAEDLAKHGATVVVSGTNQEKSEVAAKEIADAYNVPTLGISTNVSSQESCQNLIDKATEAFGTVHILVNNAGIAKDNLLLRMKPEDWDAVVQTNLNSSFYTTKAAIKSMLKAKWGRIINISSVVGVMGNPGQANYAASKAGMIGFSKSIAKELGAKGITCNVVAPGFIQTDMIDELPDDYLDNIISQVPAKRLGTTDDIANLVTFLASDLSSYITGEVITVDGGLQM